MTETDFRVKHSELIEYYQLIEERLRGICAELMADDEKNWFNKFRDYELEPFGSLIKKLKDIQGQNQIVLLNEEDFGKLDDLRKARNYWVHQCFGFHNNVTFPGGECVILNMKERFVQISTKLQSGMKSLRIL